MKLSIIIVSWNTCELTLKCVKSVFKYLNFCHSHERKFASGKLSQNSEIKLDPAARERRDDRKEKRDDKLEVFIVDNNSSDNTVEKLEKINPVKSLHDHGVKPRVPSNRDLRGASLKIIKNKNNLGFAKANNQAIKQATGDFILLLNPDTEFIDNSILKLIEFMRDKELDPSLRSGQAKKIGIVGPKLLNSDKTLQRSCRRFPKLIDQIFIQLKFYNFFPNKISAIKKYFMLDFNFDEIREVDQIMGAAMLIKREVFDNIGFLDEKFWLVFEEVDFCKRAKDAGYKIYFNPDCQIIHHKEQSFKQINNFKKQINFNKSLYYYFKKHRPFYELFILWLLQPINLFLVFINNKFKIRKIFVKKKDL